MEARRALAVALVAAAAAVGIVAADTVFGLTVRIDAQDAGGWTTVWTDPTRQRESYAMPVHRGMDCFARHFQVVAENDKPVPDALDVRVTYWDNGTKRTTTLAEETLRMGAFETKTLEFTVPASAGVGPDYVPTKEYSIPPQATVSFDGGWERGGTEATVCVGGGP